jgi:hypothetical protein
MELSSTIHESFASPRKCLQTDLPVKLPQPRQDANGKYVPNGASAKAGLNKSFQDAGWGMFVDMVFFKAKCAGRTLVSICKYVRVEQGKKYFLILILLNC